MNFISNAKISGIGAFVPEKKLTNADLEKMVDTTDEWILQRTGIEERRIASENEFSSHLAIQAVRDLHQRYPFDFQEIDYLVVASFTPDFLTPSVSSQVHGAFNFKAETGVVDINAACAGFVQGLFIANSFISCGLAQKVIVIGSETMTKVVDYQDRNTCVLFGDGASCVLVEKGTAESNFLAAHYGAIGSLADKLYCSGLSRTFNGEPLVVEGKFWQDGRAVYNFAIRTIPKAIEDLLSKAGLSPQAIDWFIPHSANLRMIASICEKVGIPMEKTLTSVERYGNTSSASIPLALWEADKAGKIKKGDIILMYGFGGGLNYAGTIIRW